jgi:hypothetical protein
MDGGMKGGVSATILVRKTGSAVRLYRRHGLSLVAEMARAQIGAFLRANALMPLRSGRRADLLSRALNAGALVSAVSIEASDVAACRTAVLFPYIRGQIFDAATAAAGVADPSPIEILILADCWLRLFDFHALDRRLAAWRGNLAGTKFEARLAQLARRVDLRLGRLGAAGAGLDDRGAGADEAGASRRDVADWLLQADVCDAQGRLDAATAAYQEAIRRQGYLREVRLAFAFHLLKRGRLIEGFTNWAVADGLIGEYPLRRHRPAWTGGAIGTQRLMVVFEHGFGDMIQLARFLVPLRRTEPQARILGRVPSPLLALMARSFPSVRFVGDDEREPDYDLFVPSVQLPSILGIESLEPTADYIDLGPAAAFPAAAGGPRRRVGICWRGQPRQYELTRSVPLAVFARLFATRNVEFVVLLHRLTAEEAALAQGFDNVLMPPIKDFTTLGALVAACDLVVSVDTAVAHVAGAGGRSTLLLSRPDPCWRWGGSGTHSPWYRTVEVLRHPGDMDWPTVLDEAGRRIERLAGASSPEPASP